jgi:hypothetical protein
MALQSLILPIITLFRSAGVNAARNAVKGLGGDFSALASNIGQAAGAFSAFQALSGTREFLIGAVNTSQQFERNMLALSQVFEGMTPQLRRFTKEVESYGIGQNQAAQASVFIGSVLKQYGFNVDEAADATSRIVKLAQDLATTYGYDVSEALLAVTALFRGEFDPIEKFGVSMKQNEINAELAARGLGHLEGAARENAEAIITLDFLFNRASDSVGAFARAQDTLYAAQKRLEAGLFNLQIAFGDELQEPIANVVNYIADLVQKHGPDLVVIAKDIARGFDNLQPLFEATASTLFELIEALEPVVALLSGIAELVGTILTPVLLVVNDSLDRFNRLWDVFRVAVDSAGVSIDKLLGKDLEQWLKDNSLIVQGYYKQLDLLNKFLEDSANDTENWIYENDLAAKAARDNTNELKRFELQGQRSAEALLEMQRAAELVQTPLTGFLGILNDVGIEAEDAEGKLVGLGAVFGQIENAAKQSEAKDALLEIGFSAAQIEEILTRPDWEQIFKAITRLAQLAALDISKSMSVTAAALYYNTKDALEKLLKDGFKTTGGGATDFVGEFFGGINEEIAKQSARIKLKKMGASEGLIDAILGSDGWEKVLAKAISGGVGGLKKLQAQFNRTQAGIEEITAATDAFDKAQQEALDNATKQAEEHIKALQKVADDLKEKYLEADRAAKEFLKGIDKINSIEILPNAEEEIGRFEQAVIGSVTRIRSELENAFDRNLIYKEDFEAISAFVAAEEFELRRLAKVRDDLAKRYTLSEALINEYRGALTSALQLTSLFSKLKNETEKQTITEVQRGVVRLGRSLREFEVVVTQSYEKTLETVTDKSQEVLQGFRDMAQKARDFAQNLRTLRAMGLSGELFNQLVQAGVEAGGETAQALVDGGSDTINEINNLFEEINALGADLGEEVAATMYGAGIDMTNGLLAGIASEQEKMLALARSMAEAFSREFKAKIEIAVDKPVEAAKKKFDDAAALVPKIEEIDLQALAKINTLIENTNKWLGKNLSVFERIRSEDILEIYQGLRTDILNRVPINLAGIGPGMSVEEAIQAAKVAGGQSINNFYLTVTADSYVSGSKAGEAIVDKLNAFTRANGAGGGGLLAQLL